MSADPNYVIGVVATALQECKVDTVSQEWVLLELRAALVAPDPAPTGYLPGMAFGTGGNRLDPAPLDLDDTLYAESDSIARRVERPTTAHPDYCPCCRVAFRPQPLGGRMQAVRCGGCNRTLGNCNCAAQPDSEAKR